MILAGNLVFYAIALVLLVPAALLCAECVAALLPRRASARPAAPGLRRVVLVPAHDEAAEIGACLASVQPQLGERDRLVVVADNCADATAAVARRCGAEVIERRDPDRHGKGFALDHGLRFVAPDPPDVVVVIDADCVVSNGAIERLASQAFLTDRPAQAAYVLQPPPRPRPEAVVSAFAFRVKNVVRPLGLTRLGVPCLLTGTGMAFPWSALAGVSLASGRTAEDMRLTIDLALTGHPPLFCPGAVVSGCLPELEQAAGNQRTLWEHGHLATLLEDAPRLFKAALRQRRWTLAAMGLDVCVPPLSLLVLLWAIATTASVLWGAATGLWGSAALVTTVGLLVCLAVGASRVCCGRSSIPLSALWTVPRYVASRAPSYLAFLVSPRNLWVLRQPRAAGAGGAVDRHAFRTGLESEQPSGNSPSRIDLPTVFVGGIRVHALTEAQCVDHVIRRLSVDSGGWIVTVNIDHLRLFAREPGYAALCAQSDLIVPDGTPLVWASRLQGTPLPERVAGSNLIWSLTAAAAGAGRAVFLLGGAAGTAQAAAAVLRRLHPALRVAGTFCPAVGFERDPREIARITALVAASAPDIVYVGLGKPKQDVLIQHLRTRLPKAWFIGVGTSFSFVSGATPRAPSWMQRSGLEWLHRLAQAPRDLAARYVVHGLPVAVGLLGGAAIRRLR